MLDCMVLFLLFSMLRFFGVSCADRVGEGVAGLETDHEARDLSD
jgi:hypothetical protein